MMRDATNADRTLLQIYIDNVAGTAPTEPRPASALAPPHALQTKGKLSNLCKQVMTGVMEELHNTGQKDFKQTPVLNILTGVVTVDVKQDDPAQNGSIFLMVMERFRHIVVTRDHLSEAELPACIDGLD
jgi:hypothetical protein